MGPCFALSLTQPDMPGRLLYFVFGCVVSSLPHPAFSLGAVHRLLIAVASLLEGAGLSSSGA